MNAVRNLAQGYIRRGPSPSVPLFHGRSTAIGPVLAQHRLSALPNASAHNNINCSHPYNPQTQTQTQMQIRFISKYISKSAKKRIPLTTKRAGKGYYKGNGSTKEGRLTSKGRFLSDPKKKLELVAPDLEGFNLKPYIARKASKIAPELRRRPGQV